MSYKNRWKVKRSIRLRMVIPIMLITILASFVIGGMSYYRARQEMVSMAVSEAMSLARIAAGQADGDLLGGITQGSAVTPEYEKIVQDLSAVKEDSSIMYLYVVGIRDNKLVYLLDTDTSESACGIGEEATDFAEEEIEKIKLGEEFSTGEIYKTEDGNLISAYAPVMDSTGACVGMVGSDYNADEVTSALRTLLFTIVLITQGLIIMASLLINFLVGGTVKRIRAVGDKIYDIVNSDGDLTRKLDINSKDELEVIAGYVNDLLDHFHIVISSIVHSSNQLDDSVKSSLDRTLSTNQGISKVFTEMEQMSAGMQETNASIIQVGEIMDHMMETLTGLAHNSASGTKMTEEIQVKAESVKADATNKKIMAEEKAKQMAVSLHEKVEASKAVDEIHSLTEVILSIASQTNLLALNASIEAARAGEAGRGFSVVAEEITKLADDSAKTAEEIRGISKIVITTVEELSAEARNMLSYLEEETISGFSELEDVGGQYKEDSAEIHTMMAEFSEEFEEFRDSMEKIKDSLAAITLAVDESTNAIVNITETSEQLNRDAVALKEDTDRNLSIADLLKNESGKFKI